MPRYERTTIEGVELFSREAGMESDPTLLLLHGFPSSSHMYRELIPALEEEYHLVAPDYPGFGHSDDPPPTEFVLLIRTADGLGREIRDRTRTGTVESVYDGLRRPDRIPNCRATPEMD